MGKFLAAVKARLTDSEEERIRKVKTRSRARARRPVRPAGTAMGAARGKLSLMPRMAGVAPVGPVDAFPAVNTAPMRAGPGSAGSSTYPPFGRLTNAALPALDLRDLTDAPAPNTRAIGRAVRMGRTPRQRVRGATMLRMRR